MELNLVGRKALVVGASRGIGRAVAVGFAREGCRVTAVARTESALEALVAEVGGVAAGHRYCAADLMLEDAPKRLAQRLVTEEGPPDIVVHAVGGPLEVRDPLAAMTEWRRVWQFNAGIAIEMNEVLIPPMIERRWGRVVHISSISAEMLRGCPAYASAKAYLNAYTRTLGRAIAQSGVVVSAVMPGAVAFKGSYWDDQIHSKAERVNDFLRHHQAVGRFGTPEEIAHFVVFMGSDLATFAQAAVLPVDGANM